MKDNDIMKCIKNNTQRLIDLKIIRNEKDLKNPTLSMLEKISNELSICIKDIICCYCSNGDCMGDNHCCK